MTPKQAIAEAKKLYPKWVAQDEDGIWWAYTNKPRISSYHNNWVVQGTPDGFQLSQSDGKKYPDWKKSLREVKS